MTENYSPKHWANNLTTLLNAAYLTDRFPVKIKQFAIDYSKQLFPDDPIINVLGGSLPGFEGGLFKAEDGKKGWGIIYNEDIRSTGRINFTLAHEFGHYLLHRLIYPDGFQCGDEDMASWGSEYGQLESQANDFAATLLMPLDDFRHQISARSQPDIDAFGNCADRYQVSLIAAILRWLQYTERRSVLVVSRDEFILWARSSKSALKSDAFFRTANTAPVSIPTASLAAQRNLIDGSKGVADLDRRVWFQEPCREEVLFSDHYDFTISILHLDDSVSRFSMDEEGEEDTYDRMMSRTPGSSWLG